MTKIVLVGGGGHCLTCMDVIDSAGREVAGILDPRPDAAPEGAAWLGTDAWIAMPEAATVQFLVALGQVRSADARRRLFEAIRHHGRAFATVCSPHAVVARGATLGVGTVVMHRAVVNAFAQVGNNCIVNTGAIVEHGAVVEDHCHVATGAVVNGDVRIGSGTLIGSGAVILQGLSLASNVLVGAGAVVTHNIDAPGIWLGVPARRHL